MLHHTFERTCPFRRLDMLVGLPSIGSRGLLAQLLLVGALLLLVGLVPLRNLLAQENDLRAPVSQEISYMRDIEPILESYCFDCHGYGESEGGLTLDSYPSEEARLADPSTWLAVLKNVRADVMPPDGAERPSADQERLLATWIKTQVFRTDPEMPDPGHVTLHRLNRLEYRNTIRELMGVDYDTSVEFPPDDSGDGFDNNADALSISPLLTEKYLLAAADIVDRAVPKVSRVVSSLTIDPTRFGAAAKRGWSFDEPATASTTFQTAQRADYRLTIPFDIRSSFNFNDSRASVTFRLDGEPFFEKPYQWNPNQSGLARFATELSEGEHTLQVVVTPKKKASKELDGKPIAIDDGTFVRLALQPILVEGPLDRSRWNVPSNYHRFFPRTEPPSDWFEQNRYAREVLTDFCGRAFRRPVDDGFLNRLLSLAGFGQAPRVGTPVDANEDSFELKIARAMTAALASPRFLFRIEQPAPDSTDRFPLVDEYALASRLSYLLWSSMPDNQLFELARDGQLRANLPREISRMLADERSSAFIDNFVGQWLQTRDVETVSIDALAALGLREEYDQIRDYLRTVPDGFSRPGDEVEQRQKDAYQRYRELRRYRDALDQRSRVDMGRQTRAFFAYVIREDRSLLELLDADYEFLNDRLAKHYGITPADSAGTRLDGDLRKVSLPAESPYGGVLTQGTFLLVTSNPTRTSPVKRGLFILDNILGTPAPPAPAEVPELEAAAETQEHAKTTLRDLLEIHRREALCQSCHARFDPLGLAFENFTAIGTWRNTENGAAVDASGQLISGEPFRDVQELKSILVGSRRLDFYRCLSERLLSYAIGRSLSFGDELSLDRIVEELEANGGRASTLIRGVIASSAFQRMRVASGDVASTR
ncbi:MAG: DUF1592 domain-containing protein [Planctomycetota bacterium]